MKRRLRQRGHLVERSPGHWAFVVSVIDPATGRRRRVWHAIEAKSAMDAKIARDAILNRIDGRTNLEPAKLTVAAFLGKWLDHVKSNVSPKTFERYAGLVHNNLVPALGGVMLTKLNGMQISLAYSDALKGGRKDRKGGLSAQTIQHMHRTLFAALAQAVRWNMLPSNPAELEKRDRPRVERRKMATYDLAQTAQLLDATRGSRMFVPTLLAVLCGLRRGEIAGLLWRHVDLDTGTLAVERSAEQTKAGVRYKPPKSGQGRTVALSATVVAELRAHRLQQAQELLRLGVRPADDGFIVAQFDGAPYPPDRLTREWIRIAGRLSLPRIRLHDLRHAHATHLLASGVHPKVASERLGHSRVGITLDLYSHATPNMQRDAASTVDDALRAAIDKRTSER